jgi:hypothetical protein
MVSVRTAGIILGGLIAGWLISEVIELMPGIRRTSVIGSTVAQSPPTTLAVTSSNVAETRPTPTVRRVRRLATTPSATSKSSIKPHEAPRTLQTSTTDAAKVSRDTDAPHAVIDWLLTRSSNR